MPPTHTPPSRSSRPKRATTKTKLPARAGAPRKVAGDGPKLERRYGSSLTHQLYLILRDQILSAQRAPSSLLPSENDLAESFSVSRVTLRAAMAALEADGLVERRQGVGTFVADRVVLTEVHGRVEDLISHITQVTERTEIRLVELEYVKAPRHVQVIFGSDPDAVFQRAVRVRARRKRPLMHVTTYIPQHIAKEFSRKEMGTIALWKLFERSGYRLDSGVRVLSAQLADPAVAALLESAVGAPLIQVREHHIAEGGEVFEYFELLASPTDYEIRLTLDSHWDAE